MKMHWFKLTLAAVLTMALAVAGTGCSDSSITAPTPTLNGSESPMLTPQPDLGDTRESSFEFSGRIDKLIPEDNLIVLLDKRMVIRITEDTKAFLHQSRTRGAFRFSMVEVGNKLTVHGQLQEDNSITADLIEVLSDASITAESSR